MNPKMFLITKFIFFVLAIVSFSACGMLDKTEVSAVTPLNVNHSQNNPEKQETSLSTNSFTPNAAAGICKNKYFPVSNGAKWRYKVTSSKKSDTYTYTVSHAGGADKFTQTQDISLGEETELKIDWLCFPEGLRTAKYGQITGNPNIGMKLDSKGGSGITLPKDTDWQIGKKWTSAYDLGGTFEMKPIKGVVTGNVVLNHEILSMEDKVNVSAGEFTAAKVKTVISLKASFQNRQLPAESLTMINWYAPDVGLVKQEVTGTMGKMTMDYLGK